jgi:hypothetical protein
MGDLSLFICNDAPQYSHRKVSSASLGILHGAPHCGQIIDAKNSVIVILHCYVYNQNSPLVRIVKQNHGNLPMWVI